MSEHDHSNHDCAHCAALAAGMSQEEALIAGLADTKKMIEEAGIAIVGVFASDDTPPFCYTVGFTSMGFPEVICVGGLDMQMLAHYFNIYHAELLAGSKKPGAGMINDYFNLPVAVIECDERVEEFGTQAFAYYEIVEEDKVKPKFVQWVLSDRNGKFAWDGDFTNHFGQPILGPHPA